MNQSMFDYLCCPACKKGFKKNASTLVCRGCKKSYEIRSGIPVLIDFASIPEHLHKQIRYFEHEDEVRGDWALEPWQARYVRNFLDIAKPKPAGLIIDSATGSGYMAIELARRGFKVIATDLTMRELIRLQMLAVNLGVSKNILIVCCTSESLPIKSHIADGLVANAILEHLPKEVEAIAEIARVVKRGACVMVAMPIAFRYLLPIFWPLNWLHDRRIGHLRRYTRERILEKFTGFGEIATYYTGGAVKVLCAILYLLTNYAPLLKLGEWADTATESLPYGSSNVVSILKKISR
ncbi:MAG: methyltransferase domain-containing protein [Patescibacteria group bacterium]